MHAFCATWFKEEKTRAEHKDRRKDVETLKKAAHQDFMRVAKYKKGHKFRVAGGAGQPDISVNCSHQPSTCAFNEKNIKEKIAPKIDWQKVFAPGLDAKGQAKALVAAVQTARRTYTPLMKLDIKARKRKPFEMEHDHGICSQALKYRRLQMELAAMDARTEELRHKDLMKQAIEEMKARNKTIKEVWSRAKNQMFVVRLVQRSEAAYLRVDLMKECAEALLKDPSVPRDATILARLLEAVEKRRGVKTWEELVVQPKADYEAAVRAQQQFQEQGGGGGGGVIGPDSDYYEPR